MKFRNFDLEFDIFEAATAEKYEAAVAKVQKANELKPDEETMTETIRRECGTVFAFFDSLLGAEARKELFGERVNLLECLDAFAEFIAVVDAQKAALTERIQKYSPNRTARRTEKK